MINKKEEENERKSALSIEYFLEKFEKYSKKELENIYEKPNEAIPNWPSQFHSKERENATEAAVRILEEKGYTHETSSIIAWQRRPEETKRKFIAGISPEINN